MNLKLRLFLLPVIMLFYTVPGDLKSSIKNNNTSFEPAGESDYLKVYDQLHDNELSFEGMKLAMAGFEKIIEEYPDLNKNLLTIIDYSRPSTAKRLFVIDLTKNAVIFKSYVAHGKNSGLNHAESFSNRIRSYESSLGFFITGNTYYGKHGYSLRLKGLEEEINDNAFKRAIVMHAAVYVSEDFIKVNGRLGRSYGCPAVPVEGHQYLIDLIKNNTCLFAYYPDNEYLSVSKYLKQFPARSLTGNGI
ncbi:MAG: murein L,D-transpeptidase catalytic domain family protein [Bacteroidales bacterium]|nr:murein L,D-transpeptidase catalytic domain family protein [Bacteroidales bacterium]